MAELLPTTTFNGQQLFNGSTPVSSTSGTEGDDISKLIMPSKGYCVEYVRPPWMTEDDYWMEDADYWGHWPFDVRVTDVEAGTKMRADCLYYAETKVDDIARIAQERWIAKKSAKRCENQGTTGTDYKRLIEVYVGDTVPNDLSADMAFYDGEYYIPYVVGKVYQGWEQYQAGCDMTFLGTEGLLRSVKAETSI